MTRAGLLAAASAVAIGTAPVAAQTEPSMRAGYAEVNGLRMYYEVHGRGGHPLVLVHGGGSTIQTSFGAVLPGLARTRQVIAVETQAHGHTADIDRPLSFAQDADDVAALRPARHHPPVPGRARSQVRTALDHTGSTESTVGLLSVNSVDPV